MNVVVMAGGRGSRLGGVEKPLLELCGTKIIEKVLSVAYSYSQKVMVAVSPHTPRTREWCLANRIPIIDTPGKGYPHDLGVVLEVVETPILFLPADTPFLTRGLLLYFIEKALNIDTSVVTLLVSRKCFPGKQPDTVPTPIGISLFKEKRGYWSNIIMCRYPELLDIDTVEDLEEAERVCRQ